MHWGKSGKQTESDDRSQETCQHEEFRICGPRIDVLTGAFGGILFFRGRISACICWKRLQKCSRFLRIEKKIGDQNEKKR